MAGRRKHILFAIASLGLLFAALWLPINATRQYSLPKEDQKYIRRVYADQTVGQRIDSANKITRLDISIRGNGTYDGTLAVINANGLVVGQTNLSLTPDDQWVRLELDPPLSARDQTFTLASPTNEIQDQAILVRYQPQSDIYTDGHMVVKQDRTL